MKMNNIIAIRKVDVQSANNAFKHLMEKTEAFLNAESLQNPSQYKALTPSALEQKSYSVIKSCCADTPFKPSEVILVSGQKFPDIVIEQYYGVEVKATNKDDWKSTGSSIVESTRVELVENIYMLFGKLGGLVPEFRCRPYQDVLYDVAVTHSPRYMINMDLKEHETIFDKMNTTYDKFRTSSDSIEQVRRYYKQKAKREHKQEMPWWLSSSGEETTSHFNVRLWSSIEHVEKEELRVLALILFPELLTPFKNVDKYVNVSLWLCSYRQIVCPNIRDVFSAGGQIHYVDGKKLGIPLPKIFATIVKYAPAVKKMLENPTSELLELITEHNKNLLNGSSLYENWLEVCQIIADEYKVGIPLKDWISQKVDFRFTK